MTIKKTSTGRFCVSQTNAGIKWYGFGFTLAAAIDEVWGKMTAQNRFRECENCGGEGRVEVDHGRGEVRNEVCADCVCKSCFRSPCECD